MKIKEPVGYGAEGPKVEKKNDFAAYWGHSISRQVGKLNKEQNSYCADLYTGGIYKPL